MKRSIILIMMIVLLMTAAVCRADLSDQGLRDTSLQFRTMDQETSQTEGDASLYDQATRLYEKGSYYEAHKLFVQSKYGDWERMAKKCVRRWPVNGETYHDSAAWLRDTMLTFKVDQPADRAVFIRIYNNDNPISTVFIGGSDSVTVSLPGNQKYVIKDGVGSDWFGPVDTFGGDAAYETMTFGKYEEPFIYLETHYDYMITINVENVIGEDVGSEEELWENFDR